MKKLFVTSVLIISMLSAVFAQNSFGHRFFEIKVNPDLNASTNLMSLEEILQKELVIDLKAIANSMSDDGVRAVANVKPAFEINIDVPHGLILGIGAGVQVDASIGLSKDLFNFIGNGNGDNAIDIKARANNTYADLFAYSSLAIGWNGENYSWTVTPTVFASLAHFDASKSYVQLFNDENGTFGYKAHADINAFTSVDMNQAQNNPDASINELFNGNGFDIAGKLDVNLFRFLSVGVNTRIPLKPSSLNRSTRIEMDYEGQVSINDLLKGDDNTTPTPDENPNGDEGGFVIPDSVLLDDPYTIHRPLKFAVGVDFHPVGNLLSDYAAIGIGVRHPFAKDKTETKAYIDYLVGTRLSLWNILILDVSHAREDEIFKNKATLGLNLRLLEADLGVSLQSVDFAKSFGGAGLGIDLAICIGF